MIDFSGSPAHEFGPLCGVLTAIKARAETVGLEFMLVGAVARDLIHRGLGFDSRLARTTDVDIAISVPDREAYQRLVSGLEAEGDTRIRFRVHNVPVDFIPFGKIERPPGTAEPHLDGHRIDVFAIQEVFDSADSYHLPEGVFVRVPTVAGYAAMKIKAWIDIGHLGWTKHARDFNYVCSWYRNTPTLISSLYSVGVDDDLLVLADFDQDLAAMYLLGRRIRQAIGEDLAGNLANLWTPQSRDNMAAVERDDPFLPVRSIRGYEQRRRDLHAIHELLARP